MLWCDSRTFDATWKATIAPSVQIYYQNRYAIWITRYSVLPTIAKSRYGRVFRPKICDFMGYIFALKARKFFFSRFFKEKSRIFVKLYCSFKIARLSFGNVNKEFTFLLILLRKTGSRVKYGRNTVGFGVSPVIRETSVYTGALATLDISGIFGWCDSAVIFVISVMMSHIRCKHKQPTYWLLNYGDLKCWTWTKFFVGPKPERLQMEIF